MSDMQEVGGVTQVQIDGDSTGQDLVTVGGIQLPREQAVQHGLIDSDPGPMNVGSKLPAVSPSAAPNAVNADGTPMSVVTAANTEVQRIAQDPQGFQMVKAGFLAGDPSAEEFLERNAPNALAQGWDRAENWCSKMGIDANMLSTDLVDQDTKAAMINAIVTDNNLAFEQAVQSTRHALLAELREAQMEGSTFDINGMEPDAYGNLPDGTNLIDMLLRGEIDIIEE